MLFAQAIVEVLRAGSTECRAVLLEHPAAVPPDIAMVHLVGDRFTSLAERADLWRSGQLSLPTVGTFLYCDDVAQDASVAQLPVRVYVVLTGAASDLLQRCDVPFASICIIPCMVPTEAMLGSVLEAGPPRILLLLAADADRNLAEQAIFALPELPWDTRMDILVEPSGATAVSWCTSAAKSIGAGERVFVRIADDLAALDEHLCRATIVVSCAERYAGPYHGLRPLAFGKPLLALDRPLYRDAMLCGAGIRLVRPQAPGHVASCIKAVLGNPIGMAEMAERGRNYAERHSFAAFGRRLCQFYRETLQQVA